MAATRRPAGKTRAKAKPSSPSGGDGFSGTITTSGTSEAIRLEKALFRSHPEFRQSARVRAHVIAPGRLLVSVDELDTKPSRGEEDPVLGSFLSFLAGDFASHPDRIERLDSKEVGALTKLVDKVVVEDGDSIPDDVTI